MTVAVASDADHDDLVAAVNRLAEEVEQLREENEQLREELADAKNHTAAERAELAGRVADLEDADDDAAEPDVGDAKGGSSTAETTRQQPQTPLGDCVTLPEAVAEQELTENVKRARDVASDVIDYGRSVPAGYAVTSSELRTVLTALDDGGGRAYTETVRRVMDYLDELGGDDVTVKETRGGQRTVIFDDEFVRRTVAWRQSVDNGVVTEGGVPGAT